MNFLQFFSKKLFLVALFFVQLSFLGICLAGNEDEVAKKNALLKELNSVIFKQILDQDFSVEQDKLLAFYLKYELVAKYELISAAIQNEPAVASSAIEILNLLIEWQKIAQTKLEIILVVNEDLFNEYELRSIKLHALEKFYIIIQKFWERIVSDKTKLQELKEYLSDKLIVDIVKSSVPKKLSSEILELLKIDFVNFGKDWYSKYQDLINQYRTCKNDLSVLDKTFEGCIVDLLKILISQKNSLLKKQELLEVKNCGKSLKRFFGFENNNEELAINFVQNLIFKLLKIKHEILQFNVFFVSFAKLNPSKKEIMFKHMILSDDQDVKVGEFSAYFDRYKSLVEEFLSNDKMAENFSFRLEHCLYDLRKFRNSKEAKGSLYSLGIFKDSSAIKNCFLIEQMISILENVVKTIKAEKEGLLGKGEQFFEQLFNGDIKIPDKFKKFVGAFVQSLIG